MAEILESEGLGFKPCSRSVFINRINSKFSKLEKEEYAFSVDKKKEKKEKRKEGRGKGGREEDRREEGMISVYKIIAVKEFLSKV